MTVRRSSSLLAQLHAQGFDQSYHVAGARVLGTPMHSARVRCSQCEALAINGIATHERSCPNQTFACKGCNANVTRHGAYCPDCA